MKKFNAIFFILFILLVMGAFASMAQNSYGLIIMGGVAFIFGLLFIAEFITLLQNKEKKDLFKLAEPACLAIISFIFGMRVFYIHFNNVEFLFGAAAVLLMLVYVRKMMIRYRHFQSKNKTLAMLVLIFHFSIILFLISLALVPFAAKTAEYSGIASFVFLVFFLVAGFLKRDLLAEGEKVSAFALVQKFKDHSIIIVSLIIMFSFYVGLTKVGILPDIYSDEYPRAYFKLVDNATTGKEKAVEGKYKHEEFMEKYEEFMKRNSK